MKYTVFSCGIFMEHFHPFGLGSFSIGHGAGVANVGDYVLDMTLGIAEYPEKTAKGNTVRICMTSIYDVVRFIIAAVDIGPKHWPKEYTLRGDKLSLRDVVDLCGQARGGTYSSFNETRMPLTYHSTIRTQYCQICRTVVLHHLFHTNRSTRPCIILSASIGNSERALRIFTIIIERSGR